MGAGVLGEFVYQQEVERDINGEAYQGNPLWCERDDKLVKFEWWLELWI